MDNLLVLPRIMDDGAVAINPKHITMVAANADQDGIIEGTTAIYLRDGLAVAVNVPPNIVLALLADNGWATVHEYHQETVQ